MAVEEWFPIGYHWNRRSPGGKRASKTPFSTIRQHQHNGMNHDDIDETAAKTLDALT